MIEINLIPDVKLELLKARRTRALVISTSIIVSIVVGGLVVALALYVFGVQTVRSAYLDGQITQQNDQFSKVEDLSKVLTIQNQLSVISDLNAQKNMDSRLFDLLAAVIPPAPNSVQLSQVTVDAETETIRLEGQTGSYESMEVFKKTIDSAIVTYTENGEAVTVPLASDVSTTDISYGKDSQGQRVVRFTLTFTYPEELFSPAIPSVTIRLSIDGNVTDSYLGIPKSIFTERAGDL